MNENELRKLQQRFYRDVELSESSEYDGHRKVDDKVDELQGISRTISDEEYTLLEGSC